MKKIFVFLAVLLVSVSACKNPFLKKMLVEDEKEIESPAPAAPANPGVQEPQLPKYTITFGVEGGTGTLKAQVDGNEIHTGDSVEQGKPLVFTAKPAPDYVVEQWTKGGTVIGEAGTDTSYTYAVTADADIKVKFQSLFVEGGASLILSPDKLDIEVTVTTADNSSVRIEGCTETELTSGTQTVLHAKGTRVILKGNIIKLYCGSNQLTALDVQGCTALERLGCSDNQLTALNVQGCTALKELYCLGNQLTALNVQGCTALESLDCRDNQLTALNMQGLTALQTLWCYNNQLTALNVQGLTALQTLDCYNNQLTALNVQGLTALKGLGCGGNQLTALNVQGLIALKGLGCSNNQLIALNVQGLTALQWLDCDNNQLTALNMQGCTALKDLYCHGNRLTADAFKKLFDDLPVRADSDNAKCILYIEESGVSESNHTDFTAPSDLADAFNNAKNNKKWKMYKINGKGHWVGI